MSKWKFIFGVSIYKNPLTYCKMYLRDQKLEKIFFNTNKILFQRICQKISITEKLQLTTSNIKF